MYCQSCQTKLSNRDKSCPTCGRRAPGGGRDLGGSSASSSAAGSEYPLPPASTLDEEKAGTTQSKAKVSTKTPAKTSGAAKKERRKTGRRKPGRSAEAAERAAAEGAGILVRPADVRQMLVEQPELIEDGLQVYSEDGDPVGVGYETAVGDIDLLARDDAGGWVIVCVPEPDEGKEIVSDLLQRIGWVRRHLGESGEEVRGIVLLDALPDDLGYAAAAVAGTVEFKLYQMALTLESVIV
jgi:hypothetical protein